MLVDPAKAGVEMSSAGFLKQTAGNAWRDKVAIPPQTAFHGVVIRTRLDVLPDVPRNLTIFAVKPHMHALRRLMCSSIQDRQGNLVHEIYCLDHFVDAWVRLDPPFTMPIRELRDLYLVTSGVFNSTGRDQTTPIGGGSAHAEMFVRPALSTRCRARTVHRSRCLRPPPARFPARARTRQEFLGVGLPGLTGWPSPTVCCRFYDLAGVDGRYPLRM